MNITVGPNQVFSGSITLSSDQTKDVYTIEISDKIKITSVTSYHTAEDTFPIRCAPYAVSNCEEIPFTSQDGENNFQVETNLTDLDGASIEYSVVNLGTGKIKVTNADSISPTTVDFLYDNAFAQSAKPLVLSVTAKIVGGDRDGEESLPKVILQDVKDQLRQEYIDLRIAKGTVRGVLQKVPVPAREQILNSGQWIPKLVSETNFFTAGQVFKAADSIYVKKYAYIMVDRAFRMANTARVSFGAPLSLGSSSITW